MKQVQNVDDDISRELAFYNQVSTRALLQSCVFYQPWFNLYDKL
jgi:hypothetical protein